MHTLYGDLLQPSQHNSIFEIEQLNNGFIFYSSLYLQQLGTLINGRLLHTTVFGCESNFSHEYRLSICNAEDGNIFNTGFIHDKKQHTQSLLCHFTGFHVPNPFNIYFSVTNPFGPIPQVNAFSNYEDKSFRSMGYVWYQLHELDLLPNPKALTEFPSEDAAYHALSHSV